MRWISRDPIGYDGGVNLYEYVESDPINSRDPSGLAPGDWWDPRTYVDPLAPIYDMRRNFNDMKKANFIGGDKYFHCKGNCQASRRGSWGKFSSQGLSLGREALDFPKNIVKYRMSFQSSLQDCQEDLQADWKGQSSQGGSCRETCQSYRPNDLPDKY